MKNSPHLSFEALSGDTLDSEPSGALEHRFDRTRLLQISDEQFARQHSSLTYTTNFLGEHSLRVQKSLPALINRLFVFAESVGISPQITQLSLVFYTFQAWLGAGKQISPQTKLPMATLEIGKTAQDPDGTANVAVVMPDRLSSSEEVINTVRVVLSTVFGELTFAGSLPKRYPYKDRLGSGTEFHFSLFEKARLSRFMGAKVPEMKTTWEAIGKSLGELSAPQKVGERAFYQALLEEKDTTPKIKAMATPVIEHWFADFSRHFRHKPALFQQALGQKILMLLESTPCLVPHEKAQLKQLFSTKRTLFFTLLKDRIEYLLGGMRQVLVLEDLAQSTADNAEEQQQHSDCIGILRSFCRGLVDKDMAKPFLAPPRFCDRESQRQKRLFPFWIYQNVVRKYYDSLPKNKKLLDDLLRQYENNLPQRLYNHCLSLLDPAESEFSAQELRLRKAFVQRLDLDKKKLEDLLVVLAISEDYSTREEAQHKKESTQQTVDCFSKSWSYFISYALLRHYFEHLYQHNKYSRTDIDHYDRAINTYIRENMYQQTHLALAVVLIELYHRKTATLSELARLLSEECPYLDSLLLRSPQQLELLTSKSRRQHFHKLAEWLQHQREQKQEP